VTRPARNARPTEPMPPTFANYPPEARAADAARWAAEDKADGEFLDRYRRIRVAFADPSNRRRRS
jgi:hypothetical protein